MELVLSDTEFFETYRPQANPLDSSAPLAGCLIAACWRGLEHVAAIGIADPGRVWTLLEDNGRLVLASGFRCMKRKGYLITEKPAPSEVRVPVMRKSNTTVC